MVDVILDEGILHIAEELAEQMGLSIPAPELVKVAGVMVATESLKSGLELLIPSASTAMSFSTTGITLAFIQRKLREINKKIDVVLDVGRKSAKDKLSEALTSLEHENYVDANEAFKAAQDKATDGFHTSQDNERRVSCAKIKLFCILMTKCFSQSKKVFLPFANLSQKKKKEVAALMRSTIDNLLEEMKLGKSSVELMDVLMFKAGVKKKMLQVRLNELFASSYRFMSEGFQWTSPVEKLDEEADVVKIQVFPMYLPAGDPEDAIELVIGKGRKTNLPLSISIHRVILDKKTEKLVAQKTEFSVGKDFDNLLMVEIFAGKLVTFHDMTTLLIDAARVGRSEIISSVCTETETDINAKNFKGESALISAIKSNNPEALNTLIKFGGDNLDYNISDDKGNTGLHHAARLGNLMAVQTLSGKFKTLDIVNKDNGSPLTLAAMQGHVSVVQFLMPKVVSLNNKTSEGCTAIFLAAMNGHDHVVKLLLKAKADPLISREEDNASPIWIAAANGHLEVVKTLAKVLSKQRMKSPNHDGITPAKIASLNEHVTVFMFFKKQGAI